ncbi:unnamed protein product [Caenorhabditis brenneri]
MKKLVLVVLALITILNALRIGGERVDWRRLGLEALNRTLHDLGVFAHRHIVLKFDEVSREESALELIRYVRNQRTVASLSIELGMNASQDSIREYSPPVGGFKFKEFVIKGLGQWIIETAYSKISGRKDVQLQRAGLRLVSVTNAPGSMHPVELATVFDLEGTRRVIESRKGAQIGNEQRVLLARNPKR